MKKENTKQVGLMVRKELQGICSDIYNSIFCEHSVASIKQFNWDTLISELEDKTPLTLHLLQNCFPHQAKSEVTYPVICMCMAILMKGRNQKMCMLQAMVSLILYAGHAGKQV